MKIQIPNLFPDATLADAANLCRNPDGKSGGLWCNTNKADNQWGYCDAPLYTGKYKAKLPLCVARDLTICIYSIVFLRKRMENNN